jgi:hypothetical protein
MYSVYPNREITLLYTGHSSIKNKNMTDSSDLLFAELDRQIATQESGGPRVNWTQFQLALSERTAMGYYLGSDVPRAQYPKDLRQLRGKMEKSFNLQTLDNVVALPSDQP